MSEPRFRLGTTSYIIPDDLLPNVEFLADRVDDVELVLFEIDDGESNMPDDATLARLQSLAAAHNLTYTVHLPLDLELGAVDSVDHPALRKAVAVIDRTAMLEPEAFVLHAEGEHVVDDPRVHRRWIERTVAALEKLGARAGGCQRLAVENLEGYPLDFLDPVLERVEVSCCVDVGHLWLDGHDPVPFLTERLARTRVVHLHGIGTRDHQSLAHVPAESLRTVRETLEQHDYGGVVTLEVFSREDLESSIAAFAAAS